MQQLGACLECDESGAKRNVVAAIKAVAELLGNRPTTCRKYYIHPVVLELYVTGKLMQYMTVKDNERRVRGLTPMEQCIVKLLEAEKAVKRRSTAGGLRQVRRSHANDREKQASDAVPMG